MFKFLKKYTELDFLNDEILNVENQIEDKLNANAQKSEIIAARARLDKLRESLAKIG